MWEGSVLNTLLQNIIDVREHMSETGGHDDTATKTHHAGEDLRHPRAALRLLPGDPASPHRHHGDETDDPCGEAEYEHRHDLGGQQISFHLDLDLRKLQKILMFAVKL